MKFSLPVALGIIILAQIPFSGYLIMSALKNPTKMDYCPERSTAHDFSLHLKSLRNRDFLATSNMDIDGATVTALIHPKESITATVFQTNTAPSKVSFGFESKLKNGGTLTTSTSAGVVPIPKDSFAQAFPGSTAVAALKEHQTALEYLRGHGLEFEPPHTAVPSLEEVQENFCESHSKSRALFKSNFLYYSAIGTFRSIGGPNPYKKNIKEQPAVIARFAK